MREIERRADQADVRKRLGEIAGETAGPRIVFLGQQPDIVAERDGCHWHIECKGAGSGDDGSVRETFLRGLADIVRYFDPPDGVEYRMGLALERKDSQPLAKILQQLPLPEVFLSYCWRRVGHAASPTGSTKKYQ